MQSRMEQPSEQSLWGMLEGITENLKHKRLADVFRFVSFRPFETFGPHKHLRIEINYVKKGNCILHLENESISFSENEMMVICSNVEHTFEADWGELDTPWKVANCIVRARETAPIQTTAQLVEAVRPCTPKKDESKFLTKLFQALRIEVNGEMEALKMALEQSLRVLRPGGRLVVISYHSLEDRLVKNFLRSGNFAGAVEKDFYGRALTPFEILTRKAVVPSDEELERNPRSRSAKLRAAVKR